MSTVKPRKDLTGQRFGRLIVDQVSTRRTPGAGYFWLCVCDCGNVARIDGKKLRNGHTQSCGCLQKELLAERYRGKSGPAMPQWKHGRDKGGYEVVTVDGRRGFRHRFVMEQTLGRPLEPWENVHHINGIKHDNRPENLELWITRQPKGQRPEDLLEWANEIISLYGQRI